MSGMTEHPRLVGINHIALEVGDVVYHWDANQHRFVGRSLVAAAVTIDETGERYVELEGFAPIRAHASIATAVSGSIGM